MTLRLRLRLLWHGFTHPWLRREQRLAAVKRIVAEERRR